MVKNQKDFCVKLIKILLGSLIYSIAVNGFISPHHLLSGGVTGISLILQYLSNIPSGYWILIINIPIFVIGYKFVDRDFVVLSLIGTLAMSLLLILTKDIATTLKVDDIIISTIFGGVLTGVGAGIIFKAGASQGGTDIIAIIIRRKYGIKISTLYFALNGIIALLGVFITSLKLTLYTLVLMYIKSIAIDKTIVAFNKKKILLIVTSKEKEVSEVIINKIGRGTTFLYGEGAYTGIKRKIIYCVVTENELHRVKKLIEEIDEKALISIADAIDVQGRGFIKPLI
ncbi:YitT family protein [Anaerosalibacter massiliensis]|uniref:YitT family protein n=1 Tax=Anaerosalibacter massiliensis TaxID=1347392 RepID=A0A9X2S4B6_9FIRM|nr:YitT family protein [Anaerosalibacter massiliensis]MCR2043575.1 YitT family protein [Anaerosalibacter massiliensis]